MSTEFDLSEEQRSLRSTARAFAAQAWPEAEVRRRAAAGGSHDRAVWRRLGAELGMLGLAVPEELGGSGTGVVELCLLAEELGRVLGLGPVLGTLALGATALVQSGDEAAARELLPRLVEGELTLAVAATDARGAWLPSEPGVRAEQPAPDAADGSGWTLRGTAAHVLDAVDADALLVLAGTSAGPSLFLVDGSAPGLTREALSTLDATRPQATVRLDGAPGRLVGELGAGAGAVARASDVAVVVLAAEAVGGAQRMLDLSVAYAGTRLQFGRKIGSFQGVKHRCADMYAAVEHARSAAYHAAWALDEGTDDPSLAASLAHVVCSQAYVDVVADAVQVHGGIGFTWEHPAHLYYKRAVSGAALLGGRAAHTERLAALVLDVPA